jgi:hypothetical protein
VKRSAKAGEQLFAPARRGGADEVPDLLLTYTAVFNFFGVRGAGKSTLEKKVIQASLDAGTIRRILGIDYHREFGQDGRATKQQSAGPLKRTITFNELFDDPGLLDDPDLSLAVTGNPGEDSDAFGQNVVRVLRLVEDTGDMFVFCTEVGLWGNAPKEREPEEWEGEWDDPPPVCKALRDAATNSRHWGEEGVGLGLDAQRATLVERNTRTQAWETVSLAQFNKDDREALAGDFPGIDPVTLALLGVGEWVHWSSPLAASVKPAKRKKERR